MATKAGLITEINTNYPDQTLGQITPAILRTTTIDQVNSWQQAPAVNAQTGTFYTIATSDYGQLVTLNSNSPVAVSLPSATNTGFFPFNVLIKNIGNGNVTITPTSGTVDGAPSLTLISEQSAWITSDGTNYRTGLISGSGGTVYGANQILYSDNASVVHPVPPGVAGQVLTFNGGNWTTNPPSWTSANVTYAANQIIYSDNSGVLHPLATGTPGQVLTYNGGNWTTNPPGWTTPASGVAFGSNAIVYSDNAGVTHTLPAGTVGQFLTCNGANFSSNPPSWTTSTSAGNIVGSGTTVVGHLATWNNTTATAQIDTNDWAISAHALIPVVDNVSDIGVTPAQRVRAVYAVTLNGSTLNGVTHNILGSTSGTLAFNVPATVTTYALTWPPAAPAATSGVMVTTTGTISYSANLGVLGGTANVNSLYYSDNAGVLHAIAAGSAGQVLTSNGPNYSTNPPAFTSVASVPPLLPQGRITLATGTPVMSTAVAGATTVYYSPYIGQWVPVYNGTTFVNTNTGGELSQATTDTTKSPGPMGLNLNYDLFVWNDAGTIRCTRGPDWTQGGGSAVLRGSGTALVRIQGIWVNANAITNGPGAQLGTYVGTVRSNGAGTVDWNPGGAASGGVAAQIMVWNCYNRVAVQATVVDSGVTYNYASTTIRQARASAANQINFVRGLNEEGITAGYVTGVTFTATTDSATVAIGLDQATTVSLPPGVLAAVRGAGAGVSYPLNTGVSFQPGGAFNPGLGYHFLAALEAGDGTASVTFNRGSLNTLSAGMRA